MEFCDSHWKGLTDRIVARGLEDLIAADGVTAMAQLADQAQRTGGVLDPGNEDAVTPVNFDPLMHAHWAIVANAMRLMAQADFDPVTLLSNEGCPLCLINDLHAKDCTDPDCKIDKEAGFDWMLDRAADDALNKAKALWLA